MTTIFGYIYCLKQVFFEEKTVDHTYGLFEDNQCIATGSLYRNLIKCVAVLPEYSGGAMFNQLLSGLVSELYDAGYTNIYVYTKPESAQAFVHIGFRELVRTDDQVVFMERAMHGLDDWLKELATHRLNGQKLGSIVMHANPFTRGHLYLIETARAQCDGLYVFVLSEAMSPFTPQIRMNLVRLGTVGLHEIVVVPTGPYMVSNQTFPSYFIKDQSQVTSLHAKLDATLFLTRIAPVLGITDRFVGEEPLSPSTELYNKAMIDVFQNQLNLHIIPRKVSGDEVISASRVRRLLAQGDIDKTRPLVPETTYAFFQTPTGQAIQQQLAKEAKYAGKD